MTRCMPFLIAFFNEGKDLRREPLSARRAVMERSIGSSKVLLPSRRLATSGLRAFRIAQRRGYEGLVAKDLSSPYVEARSTKWLKVKVHQEDEFIIAGFTQPGVRGNFSAPFSSALMTKADCATSEKSERDSIRKPSPRCTGSFNHSFDRSPRCGTLRARRMWFSSRRDSSPKSRSKSGRPT